MKVKVGDKIYDSTDQPVMVILSVGERQQIADMAPDVTMYCQYPHEWTEDEIKEWMGIKRGDRSNWRQL